MTSRWQTIKANLVDPNAVKPWDMINPNTEWTTDEKKEERYSICKGCPEFISATTQCKQCGCIMKIKTGMEKAVCPLGKW
jgi:hypothetical protein